MSKEVFHKMLNGDIEQDETIASLVKNLYELDQLIKDVDESEAVYDAAQADLRQKRTKAKKAQEEIMELMSVYKAARYNQYYYNWGEER